MPRRAGPGFTLLQQALNLDELRRAWVSVSDNDGSPGVDNLSIRSWRRNWEERLVRLVGAVRANTYKPYKLRLRRIPKSTPGQFRLLRIPSVTDRVLQRSVAQILQPIYEREFLNCSFGYRPGCSLKQAVQQILVQRANDRLWVLDADIDACFESIDHELLLRFLDADLPDASLLPLISCWLNQSGSGEGKSRGIAMGSPLSPLLANVYLHRLDAAVVQQGYHLIRYADDFIVLEESLNQVQNAYVDVESILKDLMLQYEPSKTRITSFEQGFNFLGVEFFDDGYRYTWEDKHIEVKGDEVDALFGQYGPEYD